MSAAQVRRTVTTKTDIVEFGLNPFPDVTTATLPRAYQLAVLGLYRLSRISADRALELLRGTFDVDDLPERRQGNENEIWNYTS